jgi:hypothetical protein
MGGRGKNPSRKGDRESLTVGRPLRKLLGKASTRHRGLLSFCQFFFLSVLRTMGEEVKKVYRFT